MRHDGTEVYYLKVKLFDNLANWNFPQIPRSSSNLENLREEAEVLSHLYDKIAIFKGMELIEEIK